MRALLALYCTVCLFAAGNAIARDKVFQDLSGAYRVKDGMTSLELLQIMGGQSPIAIVPSENRYEEWHYCKTVKDLNEYFAVFMWDGKFVAGTKRYVVGKSNGLGSGSCEKYVGMGSFSVPRSLTSQLDSLQGTSWEKVVYNIDLVRITTFEEESSITCSKGAGLQIRLEGEIGPDTSFAMQRILERRPKCLDGSGEEIKPAEVFLRSAGGYLRDGYSLGKTLRDFGATVWVESGQACASSCAVAFLGGQERLVAEKGQIMFHAPYFSGKNEYGQRDIDCNVGEESLNKLKDYYISMTDKETGERLFERTMWYCSADNGWVVTGGAAAELYGIATER